MKQKYCLIGLFSYLSLVVHMFNFPVSTKFIGILIFFIIFLYIYIFCQFILFNKFFSRYKFYSDHKVLINFIVFSLPIVFGYYYVSWICSYTNCEGLGSLLFIFGLICLVGFLILTLSAESTYNWVISKIKGKTKIIIDIMGIIISLIFLATFAYYLNTNTNFFIMLTDQNLENPRSCEKIIFGDIKETCYYRSAIKTKNISLCVHSYTDCCAELGRNTLDISVCEQAMGIGAMGIGCSNACYEAIAIQTHNFSIGDIAKNRLDSSVCEEIEDNYNKDSCYIYVAINEQNLSLCELITDGQIKDGCFEKVPKKQRNIAIDTLNETLCENVINQTLKDNCYLNIAIKKEDYSLCEKIIIQNNKDMCYRYECDYNPDPDVCEKIFSQKNKDYCYLHVAIKKQNEFLCEEIVSEYYKDSCYAKT